MTTLAALFQRLVQEISAFVAPRSSSAPTASALVLGTAVAVVLTRVRVPFARTWLLISALPLAVPSYLAGYGWLVLAPGLNGFVPSWLLLTKRRRPRRPCCAAKVLRWWARWRTLPPTLRR
mgnify:CR=1 FL=1